MPSATRRRVFSPLPASSSHDQFVIRAVGDHVPSGAEGIRLVVPGKINFNKVVSGENVYIRTD